MAAAERRFGPRAATALLLVEGFCSLAIEMIALRVLVPFVGQSVGVTGIVVTAFLAALALGYRTGGEVARNASERVVRNLALAGAWSAFWLSGFGVALAFGATPSAPPLWQTAAYAAVGVAPAAYLLAQTVVLLVGSGARATASGKAGGAFSASTLGNVAGGLLTALVTMQHLGVAASVALVVGLLLASALAASGRFDWRLWASATVAALACTANLVAERSVYVLSTVHADYAVETDTDGTRFLRVNGQNASREDGTGVGHPYIEWIEDRVYGNLPHGRPARVLVVGAGGFTFGRGRPAGAAEIVYVDVDPRLGEAADAFLGGAPGTGGYVPMDGRAYLARQEGGFDAIVLDAFADRTTVPAHLQTHEFFALARSRLVADGTLYMNRIAPARPDRLAARVDRTLRAVFAWCETQTFGNGAWVNRVYACDRRPLDGDRTVYADGGARGEVDVLSWKRDP